MRRIQLNLGFSVLGLVLAMGTVLPVWAQGVPLQASPGAVLGSQYRGYIPGQPSFSSVIRPKDIQPYQYDYNIVEIEDGVLPYSTNGSQTSLQGTISTPEGHVYISP